METGIVRCKSKTTKPLLVTIGNGIEKRLILESRHSTLPGYESDNVMKSGNNAMVFLTRDVSKEEQEKENKA